MSNRMRLKICVSVSLAIASALLMACGNGSQENALNAVDHGKGTLASCLKNRGAKFAQSRDELTFFSDAQVQDTASNFGIAWDESAELFVDRWEDGEDPRTWLLWAAQPFDQEKSPLEIADSATSGSYVAFVLNPTASQRQSLEDCVTRLGTSPAKGDTRSS
jgi:hypothetical protein